MTHIEKTHEEQFDKFVTETRERLTEYVGKLPENDFEGLRGGYYEIAVAVKEAEKTLSLMELRDGLQEITRTDQRAIVDGRALHDRAKPVNHAIETVCPSNVDKVAHGFYTDYFRFRTDGYLFYAGEYNYGASDNKPSLFLDWPIVCIGRALIFASAAGKLWVEEPGFIVGCRFTGLAGRQLSHRRNEPSFHTNQSECVSPNVTLKTVMISADQVDNCLVDTVHQLLFPLYEHFDYLQLGRNRVAQIFSKKYRCDSPLFR